MELDDLKSTWATHGASLERSLAISEQLLRETMTAKAHAAMTPYVRWRVVELVVAALASVIVGTILARHLEESRYLLAGGAVLAYAIGMTVASAVIVVRGSRSDYRGPVTVIQRRIEELRILDYRATKWAVLGGVVVWLPAALVLFEAATGVPGLAQVDLAWLVANLAFGIGVLALGIWLAKRFGPRTESRIVDALAGRSLAIAKSHLVQLAQFVRE